MSKSVQMPRITKNFLVSLASFKPFLLLLDAAVFTGVLAGLGRVFDLFFDMIYFVFNGEIIINFNHKLHELN